MKRVLQILSSLGRGGIESYVTGLYKNIDREQVQFDFCIIEGRSTERLDEVEALGARVFYYPALTAKSFIKYRRWWIDFFKKHSQYDVVHCHTFTTAGIILPIAKHYGLSTIVHSHSSSGNSKGIEKMVRQLIFKRGAKIGVSDFCFACSEAAGKYAFGNREFKVMPNGIDTAAFAYDENTRLEYRERLKISDSFVIGHVGNDVPAKNHEFILRVFKSVHDIEPRAKLMLVGGLEKRGVSQIVKAFAKENGLGNDILILGVRRDVPQLMQAMDVFLFPSLYEGLGIVCIEAQCAGLHCVCSSAVPKEVKITSLLEFVPLEESAEKWAEHVIKWRNYQREDMGKTVKEAGYDAKKCAEELMGFYLKIRENGRGCAKNSW